MIYRRAFLLCVILVSALLVTGCKDKQVKSVEDHIDSISINNEANIDNVWSEYSGLSEKQKEEVSNRNSLFNAKASIIINKIDKIGNVTSGSRDVIESARIAYDSADEAVRLMVSNYSVLSAAETRFKSVDLTGTWVCDYFSNSSTIVFYPDGTCTLSVNLDGNDNKGKGKYEYDGTTIKLGSSSVPATRVQDTLILELSGGSLVYILKAQ